jgi:hypothetical protein
MRILSSGSWMMPCRVSPTIDDLLTSAIDHPRVRGDLFLKGGPSSMIKSAMLAPRTVLTSHVICQGVGLAEPPSNWDAPVALNRTAVARAVSRRDVTD